jgi:hypothetical protein
MTRNHTPARTIYHTVAGIAMAAAIGFGTSQALRADVSCQGTCDNGCVGSASGCDSCSFDAVSCVLAIDNCSAVSCDCGPGGQCVFS